MFLRKYGTGTGADVIIPIIKRGVVDFAVSADWTPAAGDVKVSKDGGTEANIATLPVINGTVGWKFVFSDAELQCKSLTVRVVDSATKAVEDQFFIVETFGHASAMFQADLSAANLPANVVQISGDSTAADNLEAAADGTGFNLGAGQIVAASVSGAVGSVSGAVGSVTGNLGGNVVGSVASVVGAVGSVTGAVGSVTGNLGGNVNGNVSGNVSGSVGSVTGAVGSVTGSVGSVVGSVGGSVASVAGAVGSVTGNLGGDVSGKVLGNGSGTISGDGVRAESVTGAVGSVTGSVGAVVGAVELDSATTTKIDSILEDTGTTLPTQIAALNDLSSADIEAALGTGTWATEVPWNASWDAEVQSEVQDAIEVNNLDHLLKIAVDTNFATTVHLDSVLGHIADNGTSATFSRSTDSLEAIRDRGDAAWTTGAGGGSGGASLEDIIAGVQSVSGAIVEAQNSATLSIRIGDTWTQDVESLGDLTDKTVSFAIKRRASDADTAAIVFITEGTGLTRLNGAATTAEWGSIEILDEVAGDIRLRLESDATSLLTSGSYVDAVKLLEDGDDRSPRNAGRTVVSAGVIADIT